MKALIAVALALTVTACASGPQRTQVGPGIYMMTGQNATVFGSYHSKVAELMQSANVHCAEQGKGATMLNSDGRESRMGSPGGLVPRAGQTASASVTYKCE